MNELEVVKKYVDLLKIHFGFDIIIYDECRLLKDTPLAEIAEVGKWHTNAYCLKIKENERLQRRCVNLKQDFVRKVVESNGLVKSTCFCGVTEYVMPIFVNNQLVCMVAASGFYGKISERTERILGKRVGIDYIEFSSFRKASLKNAADENTLSDALSILCHLLVRFISDNTDIPKRISSMQYTANAHVLKAVEYIAHSFSDTISAEDVANHCHINLSYLQHLFSSFLGHGIAEHIRLCRLAYAEELLCTTDYSVRYIALISGFSSPDYFSTAFCKHFGISPLKYRSAYKR